MIYKSKLANSAIAISKNRPAGAELLANLNTEIILMDDGFQHFAIKPDLSLCLIDVSDLQHYKNSSLTSTMPAGIFRELPSIGIRRADRVVFIKRSTITDADLEEINKIRDQYSIEEYSLIEIQANQIKDGFTKQATVPLGKSIVTFSSIAKPQTFHENLKAMGYQITNSHIFEDHHKFTESDFRKICGNHKSPIVCTYKDLVKVENWISQESAIYYLEQKVVDVSDGNFNIVSYLENQIELKRATG